MKKLKLIITFSFLLTLIFIAGCSSGSKLDDAFKGEKFTILKSQSCGCCGIYTQYADQQGFAVSVQNFPDLSGIKEKYQIPAQLQSCHTSIVGDYFVEGHVPVEAINKLLSEKPDILGIALPGMPYGTPGMPGAKNQPWVIYAVHKDGSTTEFMRI